MHVPQCSKQPRNGSNLSVHQQMNGWRKCGTCLSMGFPGGVSGKEPACQCWRSKRLRVPSLGGDDPLEEGAATHSSILAWRIPWTEEPGSYSQVGQKEMDMTEATEHSPHSIQWSLTNTIMTMPLKDGKKNQSSVRRGINIWLSVHTHTCTKYIKRGVEWGVDAVKTIIFFLYV